MQCYGGGGGGRRKGAAVILWGLDCQKIPTLMNLTADLGTGAEFQMPWLELLEEDLCKYLHVGP